MNNDSTISAEERERLQKLYTNGNKQMMNQNYDYANEMFRECFLRDSGNIIYLKSFLDNLRKKYGEKKKKGIFGFLSGGKKEATTEKKAEVILKAGIDSLQSDPWDINALLSSGGACEVLGYHDSALEFYKAAVNSNPDNVEANKICAKALRENADYDGALLCIKRILKVKPNDMEAERMQKDITIEKTIHKGQYATGDSNKVRDTALNMKSGVVAENEDAMGRTLTLVEQIERRIKKNPNDLANYIDLAEHYYQTADYAKSEEYYTQAVKISNQDLEMIERLLDAQKQKLHAEVVNLKDEFAKNKDESIKNEFYRLKAEFDKKNIELVQHRIKCHPNHAGYHFDYGLLLQKQGEFRDAIAEFQHAKADSSRKGECLLAIGQCFQQIKQYKLAMEHYQESVELLAETDENKKKGLYLITKLAFAMEDYNKAEEYGHRLAAIDFSYKDLGELLDKVAQKRKI
ncbi:MAG: tetratricopeptide repeat protein [Planctomycetaceae bacterium]|jgi:tetratricopeptide (TPR) repeat protein|nr:tetratricopeptide repeat protein [Planctomycetaceae bacterium]